MSAILIGKPPRVTVRHSGYGKHSTESGLFASETSPGNRKAVRTLAEIAGSRADSVRYFCKW